MMQVGSLFSGMLGLDLAVERATGASLAWACEIEPLPRRLIRARRPAARLFDDVRRLRPPPCDILTGGFPCQDISVAGLQAGLAGAKSGLWGEMRRVIAECRPRLVLVENVRNLRTLGLREVLADLQALGYAAEWQTVQALAAGALHKRSRIFIVAYPDMEGAPLLFHDGLRDEYQRAFEVNRNGFWSRFPCSPVISSGDMPTDVRNARLTATGNAVCPMQAAPMAAAMMGDGMPFGVQVEHAGEKLPFAGAARGGRIYARDVAVPESLATSWHAAWCEVNPAAAAAVLPAGRGTGPTPCTTDAASAARHTTDDDGTMHPGTTLTDAARLWATPRSEDSQSSGMRVARGTADTLTAQARLWATPAAANWRSGSVGDDCFDRNSRPLQERVLRLYPTPTTSDVNGASNPEGRQGGPALRDVACVSSAAGGRFLNPTWVAWLMGFPAGWFDGTSDHDAQIGLFT